MNSGPWCETHWRGNSPDDHGLQLADHPTTRQRGVGHQAIISHTMSASGAFSTTEGSSSLRSTVPSLVKSWSQQPDPNREVAGDHRKAAPSLQRYHRARSQPCSDQLHHHLGHGPIHCERSKSGATNSLALLPCSGTNFPCYRAKIPCPDRPPCSEPRPEIAVGLGRFAPRSPDRLKFPCCFAY